MKRFLIDKTIFLVIEIIIMILIPLYLGPVFTLIFELMAIFSAVYLCRHILLLPLDLIVGKTKKEMYFSSQRGYEENQVFKGKYPNWYFHYGENEKVSLVVPSCYDSVPEKDIKIKVTYYRYSKILLDWEA